MLFNEDDDSGVTKGTDRGVTLTLGFTLRFGNHSGHPSSSNEPVVPHPFRKRFQCCSPGNLPSAEFHLRT